MKKLFVLLFLCSCGDVGSSHSNAEVNTNTEIKCHKECTQEALDVFAIHTVCNDQEVGSPDFFSTDDAPVECAALVEGTTTS